MNERQQKAAAAQFAERWQGRGYEKGESQPFWMELVAEVFGVEHPADYIKFEDTVHIDNTAFIDGYIPSTKVLIEQKGITKDLRTPIRQSDGAMLTPFQQAKRYAAELPYSMRPRWIVTCNFKEFLIYDMERPNDAPESLLLADFGHEYYRLSFLVDAGNEHIAREMEVSIQAGELIGKIYDELLEQFGDSDEVTLRQLNILCVRLVFLLYAEDAGVYRHNQFYDYLIGVDAAHTRSALLELFETLSTPAEKRSRFLRADLAAFPYTNGGLFDERIDIPQFTDHLRELLLQNASADFDWSLISPTIFGAVFESTLNPETRRSSGMHYTSVENIHKVIDPLFLDDLRRQFNEILEEPVEKKRVRRLEQFQDHLASLTFLDPACGSGNFLTETYLSLRRLENAVVNEITHGQGVLGFDEANPIKVSIDQFYGIEINDFAVSVGTAALWISEAQMLAETEKIIHRDIEFLPLHSYSNIHEGNALRTDWREIIAPERLNYIIGNPPFVGYTLQSKEQKDDILSIMVDDKGKPLSQAGKVDYVAGWYYKAAEMMQGTRIRAALVSTNSICQGEQVAGIWERLYSKYGIHIDFAYRTFRWDSEASLKAHVHCVIVGFSVAPQPEGYQHFIFDNGSIVKAENINAYLMDAPDVFVGSNKQSICDVPKMCKGSQPTDGGNFYLSPQERAEILEKEPDISKFIKKIYGAEEYINNKERYCLWLVNASPNDIRTSSFIRQRVENVRNCRLASPKKATRDYADFPHLFQEIRQPNSNYIIVPRVSSERRKYVPMSFVSPEIVASDAVLIIPSATLYHFGVLESNVHMAWMRAVCGRLEMRYRYSKDIVYNNFPWPEVDNAQREEIAATAQAILDARALYPDSSLADLYDEVTMPVELRRAHQANDRAVMRAYGFPVSRDFTEADCVARLFQLYKDIINKS